MIRVSSSLYRGAMLSTILALAFVAGCKKKVPPPPPPPPAPAPAPARPTVSLQANPTSIAVGDSTTLSWTSTDATQLTISPGVGAVTAQGSTKVNPSDSTTYTITASGPAARLIPASASPSRSLRRLLLHQRLSTMTPSSSRK
jgi:hypothetical protein